MGAYLVCVDADNQSGDLNRIPFGAEAEILRHRRLEEEVISIVKSAMYH